MDLPETFMSGGITMDTTNYNTNESSRKPHKHFSSEERGIIQALHNQGLSLRSIAKEIGCSHTAIHYEIKRGTPERKSNKGRKPSYRADYAAKVYKTNRLRCHKPCKIDSEKHEDFILWMVNQIRDYKWSIDACVGHAKKNKLFSPEELLCTKTIYNYLWSNKLPLTIFDVPNAISRKQKRKWIRRNKRLRGRSIDERPSYIEDRQEIGHWEADTVVGKRAGKEAVVLTLLERATRHYIAIRIPDKTSASVNSAMASLREEYSEHFSSIFKTITADNGAEFDSFSDNEKYGTVIYFTHPYSSSDKAQNERHNGLLRRFIPKGDSIENYTSEEILSFADNLNDLPRRILGYHTPDELFNAFVDDVYACAPDSIS